MAPARCPYGIMKNSAKIGSGGGSAFAAGITCLWQMNGRSSIPFEAWMELDLQYNHKWSLWLDLEILLRTIPAVLKGSDAA